MSKIQVLIRSQQIDYAYERIMENYGMRNIIIK